jgi:hypothetical protein
MVKRSIKSRNPVKARNPLKRPVGFYTDKKKRVRPRTERWIQGAIEKPGSLRETVQRKYGKGGFTGRGTIKTEVLEDLAKEKNVTGRRARLALTLRKLNRSKLAGYGKRGPIRINPHVPETFRGMKMRKRLKTHEQVERRLRREGLTYRKAHREALRKEHEGLSSESVSQYEGKLGSIARHKPY